MVSPKFFYSLVLVLGLFIFLTVVDQLLSPDGSWDENMFDAPYPVCQVSEKKPISSRLILYTTVIGKKYDLERISENRVAYSDLISGSGNSVDVCIQPKSQLKAYHTWMKIIDYSYLAERSDYVWFLDADAYLMSNRSVFDLIFSLPARCDLIIAIDCSGINAGSFIVRNSPWTVKFMKRVLQERNNPLIEKFWYCCEQSVIAFLQDAPDVKDHVCYVNQSEINAYPETFFYKWFCPAQYWQEGNLVLHSPGLGPNFLHWWMKRSGLKELN